MYYKYFYVVIVFFFFLTTNSSSAFAVSFSTGDLAGTWYGHHVVTGDGPTDDPRWGYGTVVIDGSGNFSADWTSPTHANETSSGSIQINSSGIFTVNSQTLTHGVMNDAKNMLVFIDGTNQNGGNGLNVLVKRASGINFSSSDIAGTWYGHHVVSGDGPADDPRWGYGTVVIDGSGNYSANWTSPTQANETSSGSIQINSSGIFTVNSQTLTHGVMNDAKNMLVFIDGTNQNGGNGLNVLVKRVSGINFSSSDLAGTWYGHHVVSGDGPADDPRWGYGIAEIDGSGNYSVNWTSPTQANETTSGSIQINSSGIFTINNQPLMHGVLCNTKDFFVFIDGSLESQGNALSIFIRRSPPVNAGPNLLLLNNL